MVARKMGGSGAARHPESAFVGKVLHGAGFAGEGAAHGIEFVGPAGGGEIGEDLGAIGQVHESAAAVVVGEVTVAEVDEAWILFSGGPAGGFEAPEGAFGAGVVAVVGGEEERGAGAAGGVEPAQGGAAIFAAGDLHEAVEHEEDAGEGGGGVEIAEGDLGGVGVVEGDVGGAFGGEGAGLVDEFGGEVEGGEVAEAEGPETEGNPAGAAAGFEQRSGEVGEKALDQEEFGAPEADLAGGAGVVDDGGEVVEIGLDGGGGDFRRRFQGVTTKHTNE